VTHLPQFVLGAAFGWCIPMAYAAQANALTAEAWLLFTANLFWTVAYDTEYAMVDRDDDLRIGVKSTAILFGRFDRVAIALLQVLAMATLAWIGQRMALPWAYWVGLVVASALLAYQQWMIRHRNRDACFAAFKHNNYVGMAVFLGIAIATLQHPLD
jgi:4-hydroxybenzoate polyprenyltransferase